MKAFLSKSLKVYIENVNVFFWLYIFWTQNLFGPTCFLIQNFSDLNIYLTKNIFAPENFFRPNIFLDLKLFFNQDSFGHKIFLDPTFFVTQNFLWDQNHANSRCLTSRLVPLPRSSPWRFWWLWSRFWKSLGFKWVENIETFSFRMISPKMVQTRPVFSWKKKRQYMMRGATSISAEGLQE